MKKIHVAVKRQDNRDYPLALEVEWQPREGARFSMVNVGLTTAEALALASKLESYAAGETSDHA